MLINYQLVLDTSISISYLLKKSKYATKNLNCTVVCCLLDREQRTQWVERLLSSVFNCLQLLSA